jgi:hypothetical protein
MRGPTCIFWASLTPFSLGREGMRGPFAVLGPSCCYVGERERGSTILTYRGRNGLLMLVYGRAYNSSFSRLLSTIILSQVRTERPRCHAPINAKFQRVPKRSKYFQSVLNKSKPCQTDFKSCCALEKAMTPSSARSSNMETRAKICMIVLVYLSSARSV